jgi:hypothetical protein
MDLVLVVGEQFYAVLRGEAASSFSVDEWIRSATLEDERQTGVEVDSLDDKLRLRILLLDFVQWEVERNFYSSQFVKKRLRILREMRKKFEGTLGRIGNAALQGVPQMTKGLSSEEEFLKKRYANVEWRRKRKEIANLSLLNAIRFVRENIHFWTTEVNPTTDDQEQLSTTRAVKYIAEIGSPYGIKESNIWKVLKRSNLASQYWGKDQYFPLPDSVSDTTKETIISNDPSFLGSSEVLKACEEAFEELIIIERDPLLLAEIKGTSGKEVSVAPRNEHSRLIIQHFRIEPVTPIP